MNLNKKLYKIETGKVLDGVCGGIAEYLGVDATVVRVIWACFAACGGCGIIAYIICALIMPRKSSDIVDSN